MEMQQRLDELRSTMARRKATAHRSRRAWDRGRAARSPAIHRPRRLLQPVRMPELDRMVTRIDRRCESPLGPRIASGTDKSATGSGTVLLRRGVQDPAARGPEPERHRHETGAQRRTGRCRWPAWRPSARDWRSAMARIGPRGTGRHHALAGAATGARARHRCGATVCSETGRRHLAPASRHGRR